MARRKSNHKKERETNLKKKTKALSELMKV